MIENIDFYSPVIVVEYLLFIVMTNFYDYGLFCD